MKKGFTLVELLGVITLLGILAIVAITPITKYIRNSKDEFYKRQIETIELAALNWTTENPYLLPTEENGVLELTLAQLQGQGYLPNNIKNPLTNELFPTDMLIEVRLVNGKYKCTVKTDSGTSGTIATSDLFLVLKGAQTVRIGLNEEYDEEGILALTKKGESLDDYQITIFYQNEPVDKIDTSKIGFYEIVYESTLDGSRAVIKRNVIVEDTEKPVLLVNNSANPPILEVEAGTYVRPDYVVTDNSVYENSKYNADLTVNVTDNVDNNKVGTYYVDYLATDYSGNETLVRLTVKIVDTINPVITIEPTTVELRQGAKFDLINGITKNIVENGSGIKSVEATLNGKVINDTEDLLAGTYEVTFVATDNALNKGYATLIVQIN